MVSDILMEVVRIFEEALEAMRKILMNGGCEESLEDTIKAAIAVNRKKPKYPVVKVVQMHSTGLRSETVTRRLIPL